MTLDCLSAVSPLSTQERPHLPEGYYRSKLFMATCTTNPLVAAASPLFSLLERLFVSATLPPVEKIRTNMQHEFHAFQSRLVGQREADETSAIAYYLLAATVDELLGKTYLKHFEKPAAFAAFTPHAADGIGPEQRFFDIVSQLRQHPHQYLDLIELAYYCLIIGFEGIQHGKADGRHVLEHLLEDLFQLIQTHRVNKLHKLFHDKHPPRILLVNRKPFVRLAMVSIGLFLTAYVGSYLSLEQKARDVQLGHAVIAQLDHSLQGY